MTLYTKYNETYFELIEITSSSEKTELYLIGKKTLIVLLDFSLILNSKLGPYFVSIWRASSIGYFL